VSLEDLGNIGEFVGAIGVVLSLVYLAIQIRQNTRQLEQNTRSVRSSSFHAAANAAGAYISPIAQDEGLAEILDRGLRGESLTDTQLTRFDALLSRLFGAYEDLFYQHRESLVEPELWESRARNLARYIRQPGGRDYWKRRGGMYAESFRRYVDDQLQDESAA
jgi:hypothetical protein